MLARRGFFFLFLPSFFVVHAFAASVTWKLTGGIDKNWYTAGNWTDGSSSYVPGINDSVTISSANITITASGTVKVGSLTLSPPSGTFTLKVASLTVTNTVSVGANATVTSTGSLAGLYISANYVNVLTNGKINVNGLGYSGGTGAGSGLGAGGVGCGGAGYGGNGGTNWGGGSGGIAYGSDTTPIHFGSSGGGLESSSDDYGDWDTVYGGAGGGLIKIFASTFTVYGTVSANGDNGSGGTYYDYEYDEEYSITGGAGSGGTIYINADKIYGSGSVTANGGSNIADLPGGSGGGGRIAIYYGTDSSAWTKTAAGVNNGTVYVEAMDQGLSAPAVSGVAISSSAIRWSWTDTGSDETGFRIYTTTRTPEIIYTAGPDVTSWDCTGLAPNTTYSIYVHVYNGQESFDSAVSSVSTLAVKPSAPTFSNVYQSSMTVTWVTGENPANPAATPYKVELSTASDFSVINKSSTSYRSALQVVLTGLNGGTTYFARLSALNNNIVGNSSLSVPLSTVTLPGPAAPPATGDSTWTGGAADGKWFTPGNWSNGVPGPTQVAKINTGGGLIITADNEIIVSSLTLTPGSGNLTLKVTTITATNNVVVGANATITSTGMVAGPPKYVDPK